MTESYPFRSVAEPHNHQINETYVKKLGLMTIDFSELKKRGLTSEQIQKGQYATKRMNNVQDTMMALGYLDANFDLNGVPGFYMKDGQRKQSGVSGLMIPVRDYLGRISSLLVRNATPKLDGNGRPKNKYMAFSSNGKEEGGKVFHTTHCPIVRGTAKEVSGTKVRVTEGILKADIACALDEETYCFGMHGLNIPSDFANLINELEISELDIAFDAGEDENTDMIRAKRKLIALAKELGIDCYVETWDSQYGKGIDDVLAAGHKDKIRYMTKEEISAMLGDVNINRPTIRILGGGLSEQATQGEQALIAAGLDIYIRGKKLVAPIKQKTEAAKGRETTIAVLHEISKTRMVDLLCMVADWEKVTADLETYPVNPPSSVAATILERFGEWKFQRLAGVIMTPTMRRDGSLLTNTGYDADTRLYLLDPPPMPEISEEPTKEDATKAIELLEGLLVDFPFADDASLSVALSALITPIVRGACTVVPMHVISAHSPGTGKSYLLDLSAGTALGQPCPVLAAGRTEEETEKRLGAALLTGQAIISIDNLNGDLSGDAMCQMIERPFINVRILGKSENVTIESRTTLFANGNNIRPTGDITRRIVQCNLDAKCERPELRKFKSNPLDTVLNDRGKYIAAILTIIRAYIVAGKPDPVKPRLASFEEWSDLVRSALVWLGKADPLDSMEQARNEDPARQTMAEVFTTLWDATGNSPVTAKDIIKLACEKEKEEDVFGDEYVSYIYPELREALTNAVGDNKNYFTARRLGNWLRRHKGRICNGLRLENKVDDHGHAAQWFLVKNKPEE